MKLFKCIIGVVLFIFSSTFFQFCEQNCGKKPVPKQDIETYLFNKVYKPDTNTLTKTFSNDSIPMDLVDTVYLMFLVKIRMAMNISEGGLFACDPVIPLIEKLADSLRIIALDSFDSNHPAGSDVSELFIISDPNNLGNFVYRYYPVNQFFLFKSSTNPLHLALTKKPSERNIRFGLYFYKNTLNDAVFLETPVLRFY